MRLLITTVRTDPNLLAKVEATHTMVAESR